MFMYYFILVEAGRGIVLCSAKENEFRYGKAFYDEMISHGTKLGDRPSESVLMVRGQYEWDCD